MRRIAGAHATAPDAEATDWEAISKLYAVLYELSPTPVIRLNHAVAVAMHAAPRAGLDLLDDDALSSQLADYPHFHAARADLLARTGDAESARGAYRRAIDTTEAGHERRLLERKLAGLD